MVLPLSPQFSLPSLTFVFSLVMSNLQPVLLLTLLKTQACSSLGLLSILSVQHKFSKADIFFSFALLFIKSHPCYLSEIPSIISNRVFAPLCPIISFMLQTQKDINLKRHFFIIIVFMYLFICFEFHRHGEYTEHLNHMLLQLGHPKQACYFSASYQPSFVTLASLLSCSELGPEGISFSLEHVPNSLPNVFPTVF